MGGLAVDVSDIDDRLHCVTLTRAGLGLLAERGHFFEVSDDDIRDKSKADIFAKCLVIVQVTWIAVQTISRKVAGYPLSPVEIHTLVHAACALVMYILWFHKPLDVQAPTVVSKAGFEDLTALMLMQSPRFSMTWYSHMDPPKDFESVDVCRHYGKRPEASFLMFDDSATSRRDEGCPSCGVHYSRSTTTEVGIADKGVPPVIPKVCGNCANSSDSERKQAETSEARTLSSPITSHPPAGIRCEPPPGVVAVSELRSGEFTPEGIGLQPLMTGRSYHELHHNAMYRRPPKPTLLAQISPALKERLPELLRIPYPEPVYWHEINLTLSEKDHKRWKLASTAFLKEVEMQGVPDPGNGKYRIFDMTQWPSFRPSEAQSINGWLWSNPPLTWRCENTNGKIMSQGQERFVSTLWLLASLYGGIHLTLWNYNFPTPKESFLWRVSAAALGSAPILVALLALLLFKFEGYNKYSSSLTHRLRKRFPGLSSDVWVSWAKRILQGGVNLTIILALVLPAILYIFARIFIVVESFISLRHVPIGVYEGGLGWSKYIPHL